MAQQCDGTTVELRNSGVTQSDTGNSAETLPDNYTNTTAGELGPLSIPMTECSFPGRLPNKFPESFPESIFRRFYVFVRLLRQSLE